MNLAVKLTLWYLGILILVLLSGGYFVFKSVEDEVYDEDVRRLRSVVDDVKEKLAQGVPTNQIHYLGVEIKRINNDRKQIPFQMLDKNIWHSNGENTERQLQAFTSYKAQNNNYLIVAKSFIVSSDDIADGVVTSLKWIFGLLIIFMIIVSSLISKYILRPLKRAVQAIQQFSLRQEHAIVLPSSDINEFKELNAFLKNMSKKALEDYKSMKEFSENASHELQTPLAIMRGKLDLLIESNLSDNQAELIASVYISIEKLSRINQSLILLAKLENQEYLDQNELNLSKLLVQVVSSFNEMIDMKHIRICTKIQNDIQICINPAQADILVANLLTNAIRHNEDHGSINIELNQAYLLISNSGPPPQFPADLLFDRFKRGNQNKDSIGLGLSIVKQICDINQFKVSYDFANGFHTLRIEFQT